MDRVPAVGERWMSKPMAAVGIGSHKGGAVVVTAVAGGPDAASTVVEHRFIASGAVGTTDLPSFIRAFVFDADPDGPVPAVTVGPTQPRPQLEVVG